MDVPFWDKTGSNLSEVDGPLYVVRYIYIPDNCRVIMYAILCFVSIATAQAMLFAQYCVHYDPTVVCLCLRIAIFDYNHCSGLLQSIEHTICLAGILSSLCIRLRPISQLSQCNIWDCVCLTYSFIFRLLWEHSKSILLSSSNRKWEPCRGMHCMSCYVGFVMTRAVCQTGRNLKGPVRWEPSVVTDSCGFRQHGMSHNI